MRSIVRQLLTATRTTETIMTHTIGRLTRTVRDDKDQYWVRHPNGTFATTLEGKRVVIHAFTRRNAIHQAKQMVGYDVAIEEARG